MYIEHPYKYDGKYYANVDGKMIEITKEVAYAMNNFYRSSQPRKVAIKNEKGEVVERKLREMNQSCQRNYLQRRMRWHFQKKNVHTNQRKKVMQF